MKELDIFQRNCLTIGTELAAEVPSSLSELRAFVTLGSYAQTSLGPRFPSHILNADHHNLRFWVRKYEIAKDLLLSKQVNIEEYQLKNHIFFNDIQNLEDLERRIGEYVEDFSSFKVIWKMDVPLFD